MSSAQRANAWIRACIILHNFSKAGGEEWHDEFGSIEEGLTHSVGNARPPPNQPSGQTADVNEYRQDTTRQDGLFAEFIATPRG